MVRSWHTCDDCIRVQLRGVLRRFCQVLVVRKPPAGSWNAAQPAISATLHQQRAANSPQSWRTRQPLPNLLPSMKSMCYEHGAAMPKLACLAAHCWLQGPGSACPAPLAPPEMQQSVSPRRGSLTPAQQGSTCSAARFVALHPAILRPTCSAATSDCSCRPRCRSVACSCSCSSP